MPVDTLLATLAVALFFGFAQPVQSNVDTTVPLSADTGTSIARDVFPLSVELAGINLYLTDPVLQFIDSRRIGLWLRLQAYDHRPEAGIAISEMGRVFVSGELDYDPGTGEVLLHNPQMDTLEFERQVGVTRRLSTDIRAAWSTRATNPIRADLPPHPYLIPFRNNIKNLVYDGKSINLIISF